MKWKIEILNEENMHGDYHALKKPVVHISWEANINVIINNRHVSRKHMDTITP